jgi:tRNA-uridine 2-sulfurtransferase
MFSLPMSSQPHPDGSCMNKKALALLSGGLDSALAIYLAQRQGIEVTAVHFTSFFSPLDAERKDSCVQSVAEQLGISLILQPKGPEFLDIIRNPRHGHGKNLNPCIDCRIYTFIKARALMEELGASFLVTGEVAGQRPMSQRRDTMRLIDKRSGCDGLVLRPLSAKLLPPTLPEKEGIVDREQLLDVAGRGRKVQMRLAAELGLKGYSAPAGGCLLTDKNFSRRARDLLADQDEVSQNDLTLLQLGRHIRIRPGLKVVVGRSEQENNRLFEEFADAGLTFYSLDCPGPLTLVRGVPTPDEEILIGGIVRRYCKESRRGTGIGIRDPQSGERRIQVTNVADDDWLAERFR